MVVGTAAVRAVPVTAGLSAGLISGSSAATLPRTADVSPRTTHLICSLYARSLEVAYRYICAAAGVRPVTSMIITMRAGGQDHGLKGESTGSKNQGRSSSSVTSATSAVHLGTKRPSGNM